MKHLLRSASLLLALSASAFAQIANGDFSSALSGWSVSGDASVRDGAGFVTNAAFSADDDNLGVGFFNFSGAEPAFTSDLETLLGLSSEALSPDTGAGVFAYEGSALFQSVSVQAGERLSFDWTFLTNEAAGADYAFVVIDGTVINLSSAFSPSAAGAYDYAFTTGAQTYVSTPFASSGTITLGFGVVDVDSFTASSALSFDNISVSAIPEPSAFAALAGLAGLALAATRRHRA